MIMFIKKNTNTYAANMKRVAKAGGNVEEMKLAVIGGIFHMASTDKKSQPQVLPQGQRLLL